MKKVIALILAILFALAITVPLLAMAEEVASAPPDTAEAVILEPTAAPMVETATTNAQETEPGGIDLTPLLQALIGVLALVVTRYVIPWLKAHTSAEKLTKIDYWYRVAVAAAEKAYGAGHGAEKLKKASEILKAQGIIVDSDVIDALILELFGNGKSKAV